MDSGKMVLARISWRVVVNSSKTIRFLAACAACLAVEAAFAAHPLVTDDTGTQGTGNNQLEINKN